MAKRWTVRANDRHLVRQICEAHQVSPIVAQILASREVTSTEHLNSFFDSRMTLLRPPQRLPGMSVAVDTILKAIRSKKQIVIYGDYDCDGMTASAILLRCIGKLGGSVSYFVPNRLDDGYGLNSEQIRKLVATGAQLIVTVDCGVASVKEALVAQEVGVELVITDHHLPGVELPIAAAIVHPGLPGGGYPFAGLCGAGVAFKLAWALCQEHSQSEKLPEPLREMLFSLMSLAAIGTVADVVPLVDENRILVRHGLKLLKTHAPLGLKFLMRFLKVNEKTEYSSENIGFGIGPRLNAAGRLGQARLGVELLTCEDPDRCEKLADYIENLNKERDKLERSIVLAANKQLQDQFDPIHESAIVLADPGWHQGVIGIVAGRIAEKHNRPTIILRNDPLSSPHATGSARSVPGFNLYDALAACHQHLIGFGGHAAAAGLTISHDSIAAFREEFCDYASRHITSDQRIPELLIDAEVALCELNLQTVRSIEAMAPFGHGNPRPILSVNNIYLNGEPKTIGADGRHLSLRIRQDDVRMQCVAFGQAEWAEQMRLDEAYDLAFKPVINEYQGMTSVQLQLVDFRPARIDATVAS
jgi:single-stranded-DNA-specific exonuclease